MDLEHEQLVIAAGVVFFVLVAFIAVLYNSRKGKGKAPGTPGQKTPLPAGETGTVFVKEGDGRVVRRSTRQHKPLTPLSTKLAAAAASDDEAGARDTVTPKKLKTPRASSSKAAAAKSPAATPSVTPRRGRPARA